MVRRDRDGNREIYVMDADGTNQVRLTNNSGLDDHPSWPPDGTNLANERVGAVDRVRRGEVADCQPSYSR